jgi:hypothetical protein
MFRHRFRDQESPAQVDLGVPAMCGAGMTFLPCPMFQAFTPAHQAQIQEIYRVAAERTREQLRPRPSRIPQLSLN